jgi:hypothetical protein
VGDEDGMNVDGEEVNPEPVGVTDIGENVGSREPSTIRNKFN